MTFLTTFGGQAWIKPFADRGITKGSAATQGFVSAGGRWSVASLRVQSPLRLSDQRLQRCRNAGSTVKVLQSKQIHHYRGILQ